MGTATITIPDEVKAEFKRFSWVNWSELAREDMVKDMDRDEALLKLDELLKNSKLTEEDVLKLSKEARKGRFKELKLQGLA